MIRWLELKENPTIAIRRQLSHLQNGLYKKMALRFEFGPFTCSFQSHFRENSFIHIQPWVQWHCNVMQCASRWFTSINKSNWSGLCWLGKMFQKWNIFSMFNLIAFGYCILQRDGLSHHGPTESRFFARARATNGLGTFTWSLWKVLRGFKNISRGALGDNSH